MIQLHRDFKGNVLVRFLYAVYLLQQSNPEKACLLLFIAPALPIRRKPGGGGAFFHICHRVTSEKGCCNQYTTMGQKWQSLMERASNASGYPFGYPDTACWGSPNPRTGRFAPSRTHRRRGFCRSSWSLLPAHPRRKNGRILRPSEVRWGQRSFTMGDRECDRVNYDNLPTCLLSVTDGSSRPTPFLPVINS